MTDRTMTDSLSKAPSGRALTMISLRQLGIAVRFLVAMTVILGVLYPLVVLGVGKAFWSDEADGSLIRDKSGAVVGSELIGQQFEGDEWFLGRPSAAGDGYDAMSSGGSNLAADSEDLLQAVEERRAAIAGADGVDPAAVPADALTASASGLDPDISVAYALLQVDRVAAARGLTSEQVRDLVESTRQGRILGFIGEERVNVLALNLALDGLPAGG
jgi:potassium-transporting ATPase KdpC subunit